MTTHLNIQGIDVTIEGQGPVVLMLHGWPDSPALWDESVAALRDGYRCVRLTLPGFDPTQPARAVSVSSMTSLLDAVVGAVSPDEPVTLLLHDWGCVFGYEYAAQHPERVVRVVGVDVGDTRSGAYLRSLTARQKAKIAAYQLSLALIWCLGHVWPALAHRATRSMARLLGCRTPSKDIGWQMNYPYAMQWFGVRGGLSRLQRADRVLGPQIPIFFAFGKHKPFMFHSARWLATLATSPSCSVQGFDTGHWIMKQQPEAFNRAVRAWLDRIT